ncbi:MAG: hypothetical protein ACR2M2_08370 [Gaiellaceae bacterium]
MDRLLVAVRLAVLGIAIWNVNTAPVTDSTVTRFDEIASTAGLPWRDHVVEFPPLQVAVIELIGWDGVPITASLLAILACGSDLLAARIIGRRWGQASRRAYLLIGLPLLAFVYLRFDPVSVVLAVGGMAGGGAWLGLAALARIWPLVLFPALRGRRLWWALGTLAVGGLAWIALGGFDAVRQVTSFRGAGGWEIGSLGGAIVWAVTGGPLRLESGAFRVGQVPGWVAPVQLLALAATLAIIWLKRDEERAGEPAAAAVAALLVLSPIISDGYVMWMVPWLAIGSMTKKRLLWQGVIVTTLTTLTFLLTEHIALFQAATIARGIVLLSVVVPALRRARTDEAALV